MIYHHLKKTEKKAGASAVTVKAVAYHLKYAEQERLLKVTFYGKSYQHLLACSFLPLAASWGREGATHPGPY